MGVDMAFYDDIREWAEKALELKGKVQTEEATKHALVLPFLQILGYNVFDPTEVVPEFTADVPGIKKNEKVDYAIIINDQPTILIEVKPSTEVLKRHSSQLTRYFNVTEAKFAILTNGYQYWFFSDLDSPNKMDSKPFLVFDLENIKEPLVGELEKFQKSKFDIDNILSRAEELKYLNEIRNYLEKSFKDPPDDFVKFLIKKTYSGRATQGVIEKFKELIKKAIHGFISDQVNERIKTALEAEPQNKQETTEEEEKPKAKVVTTPEEIEAWVLIKHALKEYLPEGHEITYQDTVHYFAITIDNSRYKWICRLYLNWPKKKYIQFPGEEKVQIYSVEDILSYKDKMIDILQKILKN